MSKKQPKEPDPVTYVSSQGEICTKTGDSSLVDAAVSRAGDAFIDLYCAAISGLCAASGGLKTKGVAQAALEVASEAYALLQDVGVETATESDA